MNWSNVISDERTCQKLKIRRQWGWNHEPKFLNWKKGRECLLLDTYLLSCASKVSSEGSHIWELNLGLDWSILYSVHVIIPGDTTSCNTNMQKALRKQAQNHSDPNVMPLSLWKTTVKMCTQCIHFNSASLLIYMRYKSIAAELITL